MAVSLQVSSSCMHHSNLLYFSTVPHAPVRSWLNLLTPQRQVGTTAH
jgi:hypothetical protein